MTRLLIVMLLVAAMMAALGAPAGALTQEEVLKRRLEKMNQADAQLRQEEQQRQEHEKQAADIPLQPNASEADLAMPVPAPVRRPGPEPKAGLWNGKDQAAQPAPVSAPTPAAAAAPAPAKPASPVTAATPPAKANAELVTSEEGSRLQDPRVAASLAASAEKAKAKGDFKTALMLLTQAIDADPDNPNLLNNRGNVRNNMGQPKEALADYDKAISLKDNDPAYFSNRGLAQERLGNQERTCADYKRACELGECDFFNSYKKEGHCR